MSLREHGIVFIAEISPSTTGMKKRGSARKEDGEEEEDVDGKEERQDQKEHVAPRISDEQILRVVQLYDFPPSSNINNATTASMLSSWLGLQDSSNSTARQGEYI